VIDVSLLEIQGREDGVGSRRHRCGMATEVWERAMDDACVVWVILMIFSCNGMAQCIVIHGDDKWHRVYSSRGCVALRLSVGAVWTHVHSILATVGDEYRKTTKNRWIREDWWERNGQKVRLLAVVPYV